MIIKVLAKKVNEEPQVLEIENDLASMQNLVDGYIESVYFEYKHGRYLLWVNEEGLLRDSPHNIKSPKGIFSEGGVIRGNIFISTEDENGATTGLYEGQIELCKDWLKEHAL